MFENGNKIPNKGTGNPYIVSGVDLSEHPYVYDQIMQKYGGVAPWDGYTLKKSIHDMDETELLYHYTDNDFSPSMMGSAYGMYGAGAYDKTVPWQWFAPEDVIVFMYSSEVGSMAGETIRTAAMATAIQNSVRNDNRSTEAINPKETVFKVNSKGDALKALKELPDDIAANVKRFIKKSGSKFTEYTVEILEDGSYQVKMLKPGDVSGYAEYYKVIDTSGTTIRTFKDTFDNLGDFVHRKPK